MGKACECTQCNGDYNSDEQDENFCSEKCYELWCKETNEREVRRNNDNRMSRVFESTRV